MDVSVQSLNRSESKSAVSSLRLNWALLESDWGNPRNPFVSFRRPLLSWFCVPLWCIKSCSQLNIFPLLHRIVSAASHTQTAGYTEWLKKMLIFWQVIVAVIVRNKVYMNLCLIMNGYRYRAGHAVAQVAEEFRYEPEGHGFDSRWCHWNFSLTQSFRPHYGPGVGSVSNNL
jgi:hypothetical protein